MRLLPVLICLSLLLLVGCGSGAVQFAPTPQPPDLSPLAYTHPGGAFSLVAPRAWTLHEQNTTVLASASFALPGETEPRVLFAVLNPGIELDSDSFGDLIEQYQTQVRPDTGRYTEQSRQAMGDGSWRMTGVRRTPLGDTQSVNTFIEYDGALVGIIDVTLPDDPALRQEMQGVVNSFRINPEASLQAAPLSSLSVASPTSLSVVHVATWTTPEGVFFITGEVSNYGSTTVTTIPVRAVLRTADGLPVADAADNVMGHGIPPGGFAPFSLRFGQGQPALATTQELVIGGETWTLPPDARILGADELAWTADSSRDNEGRVIVSGTVRNVSSQPARDVRAVVSVFNTAQDVIAAGWTTVGTGDLAPGAEATYQIAVPEMGGQPAEFIVIAQGLP